MTDPADFYQSGLGPKDAKERRPVLVQRPDKLPVVGRLVLWPIPAEIRTGEHRRRRSTTKARVELSSGAYISVHPRYVFPLNEEGATP